MDTTRRSFLRGAAALPAVAATAVNPAIATATAAFGTAAQSLSRMDNILRALGLSGGFPQGAIRSVYAFANNTADATRLARRINKQEPFRTDASYADHLNEITLGEKIAFWEERALLTILQGLPPDIPIMDLLSEDVYNAVSKGYRSTHRYMFSCYQNDIQNAREFFSHFCTADTTAHQLLGKVKNHVLSLIDHACDRPEDFQITTHENLYSPHDSQKFFAVSDIQQLQRMLHTLDVPSEDLDALNKRVNEAINRHESYAKQQFEPVYQKIREEREENVKKMAEEAKAEWKRNRQEREECFDKRHEYWIKMAVVGPGRYVIGHSIVAPTRMDWLQWLQTIDPQNAKPSDIELDCMGFLVTIKNTKALASVIIIDDKTELYIPNRRAGVDLNNREQERPFYPNPA